MDEHAQVLRALDLLQEAQRLVELAGQELCPVPSSADVWTGTAQLYFDIKRHWHRVQQWSETDG